MPVVTRAGAEIQIKEAVGRKPGAQLRFEDMADESIVRELEKSGFIDPGLQAVIVRYGEL